MAACLNCGCGNVHPDRELCSDCEHEDWLIEISKDCDCCPQCCDHPCPGVQAGGLCDQATCWCDDYEGY